MRVELAMQRETTIAHSFAENPLRLQLSDGLVSSWRQEKQVK